MLRRIFLTLTVLLLLPFLANIFGWNVFAAVDDGKRTRSAACSIGLLHLSNLPDYGDSVAELSNIEGMEAKTLVRIGSFELFIEPRFDPLHLWRFHRVRQGDDRVLELPWLLLPVVSLLLALSAPKRRPSAGDRGTTAATAVGPGDQPPAD